MSYDVEIKIFGKAQNPEATWELANAAAAEAKVDYLFDLDTKKFGELMAAASAEGGPIVLSNRDTTDLFEEIRRQCKQAGLSYVMTVSDRHAEAPSNGYAWQPKWKEYEFLMSGDKVVLSLPKIKDAAKSGIETVQKLIDDVERMTTPGAIEIDQDFIDGYVEQSGQPWPAAAQPAP